MTVIQLPNGAYAGIADDDRAARIAYSGRPRRPGDPGDHYRTHRGYSRCYRCENSATRFVYLAISSLTPVCAEHLAMLDVERDPYGTTVERVQPTTENN
ncbi:hypothetical protein QLT00_gp81 [Gordonia phage Commandaria]|uniref:Uncharacterized protein n=1 Tax=Gordonia phage Commandaria TaxID=3038364 RepID=A0AAF0GI58_9CAUD|nr:hypothetical protein QLT00_gp81 [Gordonia phage Commandaria]WGH20864.1 hypothetical protein [Gordonia phage Commandaria]